MPHIYSYNKATTFPAGLKTGQLHIQIGSEPAITTPLRRVTISAHTVNIVFESELSAPEFTVFTNIINTHVPENTDNRVIAVTGKLEYVSELPGNNAVTIAANNELGGVSISGKSGGITLDAPKLFYTYRDPKLLGNFDQAVTFTDLLSGILHGTPTSNRNLQLPDKSDIDIPFSRCIIFTVINAGSVVLGWTLVSGASGEIIGNPSVGSRSSGQFKLCMTADKYYVYRIA